MFEKLKKGLVDFFKKFILIGKEKVKKEIKENLAPEVKEKIKKGVAAKTKEHIKSRKVRKELNELVETVTDEVVDNYVSQL